MTPAPHFTPAARHHFRSLPRPTALRVLATLTAVAEDPAGPHPGAAPIGTTPGLFRLRVEGQRLACLVRGGELLVLAARAADLR
ncbi:type II toxin-antitoxin system RelE family toxin [Streptomyces sp. KR2]|uniref:type II toxin-antitoxin system RelE family toxin n=1 Tax=Streptomyces sp. KR2 TaxID=1514824 RepID=UPI003F7F6319